MTATETHPASRGRASILCLALLLLSYAPLSYSAQDENDRGTKNNVVQVTAYDYAFVAPSEVASGWARIELDNQRAEEIHEVTIVRLPDEIDYQTYLSDFIAPWMEIWDGMKAGDIDRSTLSEVASEKLPDWGAQLNYRHARGIVSAGKQASAYAYLPPGTYAVECWLKTADGHVHIAHGMISEMTVVDEPSDLAPPQHGIPLQISTAGIDVTASVSTGTHTFIAEVEQTDTGNPVYPDLHLIRVDDDHDPSNIARWLYWYELDGLTHPAPAKFLGGYSTYGSALIDNKAYFEVTITEPGEYAWVIQSDPAEPIWQPFSVTE